MCEKKQWKKEVGNANMEQLFQLEESYITREVFTHSMNFRTTKKKNKLMDEEIDLLKSLGIRMSKNDLINFCIDIVLGYRQHPENPTHHYRGKGVMTLPNYVEENREALTTMVMQRLLAKEIDLMTRPVSSKKEKKAKLQSMRRLQDQRDQLTEE